MNCSPFFRIAFYAVFLKKSSAPLNVYCNHSTQRPRQWPSQKKKRVKMEKPKSKCSCEGSVQYFKLLPEG